MNFHPVTNIIEDEVKVTNVNLQKAILSRFNQFAFRLRFYMTPEDFETLRELLHPLPLTYKSGNKNKPDEQPLYVHQHPVPAELQRYAYEKSIDFALKFKTAIDFGGTPLRTPKNTHICCLIDDARTSARYVNASLIAEGNMNTYNKLCKYGAQNCHYVAPYAYMINVYDIPIESVPYIMERHGVIILDIWMFLPHNLLNKNMVADQTFYRNEILESRGLFNCCRNKQCRFSFKGDSSNCYVHDYDNWKKYMITVQMKTKNYNYVFEHIEQRGTFTNIRVTRVDKIKISKNLSRIHHYKCYDDMYVVPNVPFYFSRLSAAGNMYYNSFIVDKTVVDNALKWCQRQADNAYNYANFQASMDSKSVAVYYTVEKQQKLVYKGIVLNHNDYHDLAISLYMIGAVMRFNRTQTIASMYHHLKNCDNSFWDLLKHSIKKYCVSIELKVKASINGMSVENYLDSLQLSETYMPNLRVKNVPLYVSAGIIDGDDYGYNETVFNQLDDLVLAQFDTVDDEIIDPKNQPKIPDDKVRTEVNKHCAELFNPPGDGKCGVHALGFYRNLYNLAEPNSVIDCSFNGIVKIPDNLHTPDDLGCIAYHIGMNLVMHHNGKIWKYLHSHDSPTAKIELLLSDKSSVGHYICVKCDCNTAYIGDYLALPYCNKYLYVNCANNMLSDGAGQAKAFNAKFAGYKKDIKVPIGPIEFTVFNGYHLALAVALDANDQKNTKKDQVDRLDIVFKALNDYALQNDLTLAMPLIGTALFGNDLCCVKRCIANLKCKYFICFFNENQNINYNNCSHCTHNLSGGYIELVSGNVHLTRSIYNDDAYCGVAPDRLENKMIVKYQDIEAMAIKHKVTKIYEITGAPGLFEKVKDKRLPYEGFWYTNGNLKPMKDSRLKPWSKYDDLPKFEKGSMVLFDYEAKDKDPFYQQALDWVRNGVRVMSKFNAYVEQDSKRSPEKLVNRYFNNCSKVFFRNEGSELTSAELYYLILDASFAPKKEEDVTNMMVVVDKYNENMQLKNGCTCNNQNEPALINAKLTFKPDKSQFDKFIEDLMKDDYIVKHCTDMMADFQKIPCEEHVVESVLGVAGSGKSNFVLNDYCGFCTLIISPLKAVSDQHNIKNDSRAVTFYKAIRLLSKYGKRYRRIFVDEIFLVNPYFLNIYEYLAPNAIIYGLGDQYQIKADFTNTAPDWDIEMTGDYILTSKRVPQAVVKYIQPYIGGFVSSNKNEGSVTFDKLENLKADENDIILCATQKMKDWLVKKYPNYEIRTIHESMGTTNGVVRIVACDINEIRYNRQSYVYVALTRGTSNFVIYGSDKEIEQFYTILGTPIERAVDSPIVKLAPYTDVIEEEIVEKTKNQEPLRTISCEYFNIDVIQNILAKVYVKKNDFVSNYTIGYRINLLRSPNSHKYLKIPMSFLNIQDVQLSGKMIGSESTVATFHGKDKLSVVNTVSKRYMDKLKKNYGPEMYKMIYDAHVQGIEMFMKPKNNRTKLILDADNVWQGVREYIIRLQSKYRNTLTDADRQYIIEQELDYYADSLENGDMRSIVEQFMANLMSSGDHDARVRLMRRKYEEMVNAYITVESGEEELNVYNQLNVEWFDYTARGIDFHMKAQPKEIRELYWDTSDKLGQGVSAWSKISNVILAAMQSIYHRWIKDNLADNVMWAVDASDHDLADEFYKRGWGGYLNNGDYHCIPADASQFDQSQITPGNDATMHLARFCGIRDDVIQYYLGRRLTNKADTLNNSDGMVEHMRFVFEQSMTSGCKMTLTGNTIYCMAMIGAELKVKDIGFAMFKGDDSLLCVKKSEFKKYRGGKKMSEICGYEIKWLHNPVPEFIANFITPDGWFPDVLRRVSRIVGRVVTHPEQWKEMQKSADQAIDVVNNDLQLQLGYQHAAHHYQNAGLQITVEDVRYMVGFLKRLTWDDNLGPSKGNCFYILYADISRALDQLYALRETLTRNTNVQRT